MSHEMFLSEWESPGGQGGYRAHAHLLQRTIFAHITFNVRRFKEQRKVLVFDAFNSFSQILDCGFFVQFSVDLVVIRVLGLL